MSLTAVKKRASERGIAALEFAVALPLLTTMLVGMLEITNLLMASERNDRLAYTVSDIVTQSKTTPSKQQFGEILLAATQVMQPYYDFATNGVAVTSAVKQVAASGGPIVLWQYVGGGALARTSKYGQPGDTVNPSTHLLPALAQGDEIVITESYYAYTPWFPSVGIFTAHDLYRAAFFKPRLGALDTAPE
jgi:Flp pilus assembly protein TadG